jgi:hypothetical protein
MRRSLLVSSVVVVFILAAPVTAGKAGISTLSTGKGSIGLRAGALSDEIITRWLEKEDLVYTKVQEGYWALDFEGDNYSPITLMIQLRKSTTDDTPAYVTYWALMQFIPDDVLEDSGTMSALTRSLLDVGYTEYLVKMVIDDDVQIGVQTELPAEGLTYDAFIKALWKVVNIADDQYPDIQHYLD